MKTVHHSDLHDWGQDSAPKITSPESIEAVRKALEDSGPVIVEWAHYMGGRHRDYLVFTDFDRFEAWLNSTVAGDDIHIWDCFSVCRDDNELTNGKSPDEGGNVPRSGAY
jgi:hypothetical protein